MSPDAAGSGQRTPENPSPNLPTLAMEVRLDPNDVELADVAFAWNPADKNETRRRCAIVHGLAAFGETFFPSKQAFLMAVATMPNPKLRAQRF